MDNVIVRLNKSEFFKLFPAESRCIELIGGNSKEVINLGTDVVCDFCNKGCFEIDEDEIVYGITYDGINISQIVCEACKKRYYNDCEIITFDELNRKIEEKQREDFESNLLFFLING